MTRGRRARGQTTALTGRAVAAAPRKAERGANVKQRSCNQWQSRKREKNYGEGVEYARCALPVAHSKDAR